MRKLPLIALGACIASAPAMVFAQSAQDKADAEVLFNAAKTALAAGNFADACPKFAESQRKDPAIGTALYLAECYERSGKIASAWAQFRVAEDMANQRHDNRAALAKQRADRLAPSKMTIVISPEAKDTSGLEVKRDGESVGSAFFGLPAPLDGGRHTVIASAPGKRAFEWSGDVPQQGGAITVTIPKLESGSTPVATATVTAPIPTVTATATVTPTATATTTATPPPDTSGGGMSGVKVAGIIIGSVGLVAMGTSLIVNVAERSTFDSVVKPNGTCDASSNPLHCTKQSDADTANNAVNISNYVGTTLFVSGAVLTVAGIVMFFVAPKSKPKSNAAWVLSPTIGGAMLSGRF
jgi:serine/threonine-protein kinase